MNQMKDSENIHEKKNEKRWEVWVMDRVKFRC